MQTWHCLVMLHSKFCYCNFLLFLTVLVGSDHNWSHSFQWMHHMAQLTHSVCFPCTEGRFGKGGLVNQLHPTTHHISFLQRRKGEGEWRQRTLTILGWTVTWGVFLRGCPFVTLTQAEETLKRLSTCQLYLPTHVILIYNFCYVQLPDHKHQRDVVYQVGLFVVHKPFSLTVMLVHNKDQL